tara:strand:+ start:546 stop:806 length:261 start_codon:yes stop_codon:yes gene_type:complete
VPLPVVARETTTLERYLPPIRHIHFKTRKAKAVLAEVVEVVEAVAAQEVECKRKDNLLPPQCKALRKDSKLNSMPNPEALTHSDPH